MRGGAGLPMPGQPMRGCAMGRCRMGTKPGRACRLRCPSPPLPMCGLNRGRTLRCSFSHRRHPKRAFSTCRCKCKNKLKSASGLITQTKEKHAEMGHARASLLMCLYCGCAALRTLGFYRIAAPDLMRPVEAIIEYMPAACVKSLICSFPC